jgi:hypothetical protein
MASRALARRAWPGLILDHLDLYLLHGRNGITDLSSVVTGFENLRSSGKIRAWGVFNFRVHARYGHLGRFPGRVARKRGSGGEVANLAAILSRCRAIAVEARVRTLS